MLTAAGKGSVESFKLFKGKSSGSLPHESLKEESPSELSVTMPKAGKVRHKPSFTDLQVEKEILGSYPTFKERLQNDSKIVLIFGKRGSGKSALGLRLMENIHAQTNRQCYVMGIRPEVLPIWIQTVTDIEHTNTGGVILVDESVLSFNARESMKETNKELSKILAIARHRGLTLLFITQNTGMIDKNILKLTDSLMIKEGSLLQQEMERPEIKKFYTKSKELLEGVSDSKLQYTYLIDADFEGLLKHSLPSFWTESISKNKAN